MDIPRIGNASEASWPRVVRHRLTDHCSRSADRSKALISSNTSISQAPCSSIAAPSPDNGRPARPITRARLRPSFGRTSRTAAASWFPHCSATPSPSRPLAGDGYRSGRPDVSSRGFPLKASRCIAGRRRADRTSSVRISIGIRGFGSWIEPKSVTTSHRAGRSARPQSPACRRNFTTLPFPTVFAGGACYSGVLANSRSSSSIGSREAVSFHARGQTPSSVRPDNLPNASILHASVRKGLAPGA